MPKTTNKYAKKSIDDLVKLLKTKPFGSKDHLEIKKVIRKHMGKKYPDQFVLCTENKFNPSVYDKTRLSHVGDIISFEALRDLELIASERTFMEDGRFKFISREIAEYSFNWKQINVFAFVVDSKNNRLFLKKKDTDEVTMIGGHVDFSMDTYRLTQLQILQQALQSELDEELKHEGQLVAPDLPIAFVNTFNNCNDLFHSAFIYKIEVNDIDDLGITTGEPKKHDASIWRSLEDLQKYKKVNQWIRLLDENDYL